MPVVSTDGFPGTIAIECWQQNGTPARTRMLAFIGWPCWAAGEEHQNSTVAEGPSPLEVSTPGRIPTGRSSSLEN